MEEQMYEIKEKWGGKNGQTLRPETRNRKRTNAFWCAIDLEVHRMSLGVMKTGNSVSGKKKKNILLSKRFQV